MVWETLMEMDRFDGKAKEGEQGAVAFFLDLAKAFETVSLPVVWATSAFQGRYCGCCAGTLSIRGEYSSKDVRRNRSRPSRPSCQVQVELFASAYCVARCGE